jgi:hypothetical protein
VRTIESMLVMTQGMQAIVGAAGIAPPETA